MAVRPMPEDVGRNDEQPPMENDVFRDMPAEERAAVMDAACALWGVTNFFDMSPEDRARAYEGD